VFVSEQCGLEVLGEVGTGLEAIEALRTLRPSVALIDLSLPDIDGVEVIRQITRNKPKIKLIALSSTYSELSLHGAMRSGASGYVLKTSSPALIIRAIRTVVENRYFLDPSLSDIAVQAILGQTAPSNTDFQKMLTTREREILQMMVRGFSCYQTAEMLCISRRTVEVHRYNIRQKLGLRNQVELISYALQTGMVHPPTPHINRGEFAE
jgi:DNA-binding NarL/FixJ family response regulator